MLVEARAARVTVATDVADPAACQPWSRGDGGVRPGRRTRQQRRRRHRRPRHPGDARAVPVGHRREPQRQLLDGAGLRTGDAARLEHRQHQLASSAYHAGLPQAAYAARKAGLIGLTRDLAQQWTARKGIRVNALAPGFFATEMTDQYPPGTSSRRARESRSAAPATPRSSPPPSSSSPATRPATSPARPFRSTAASRSPEPRWARFETTHPETTRHRHAVVARGSHLPDGRTSPHAPSLSLVHPTKGPAVQRKNLSYLVRWAHPLRALVVLGLTTASAVLARFTEDRSAALAPSRSTRPSRAT